MLRAGQIAIAAFSVVLPLRGAAQDEGGAKSLGQLIGEYFRTDEAKTRKDLATLIDKAANGAIRDVAEAVRRANLWSPIPETDRIFASAARGGYVGAVYHGFKNPEQLQARGMVLCMPGPGGLGEANVPISRAVMVLGPTLYDHSFVVALDKPIASTFHQDPTDGDDLRKIIRELRRRLRLDTDRVFLFGYGEGGPAAWNTALFHPDLFAGVIMVGSHPRLPYAEQLTPLLLPNLRNLSALAVYEGGSESVPTPEALATAAYNRAIVQLAEHLAVPVRGVETLFLARYNFGELPSYARIEPEVLKFAEHRRSPPGRNATHWFRYPAQGDLGWLRAAKLYGDPWTDDQLSILLSAETNRDAFVTAFFKEKLFYLSGEVAGQTITIGTKGIAKIDVRFYEGMVDYTQPVTIVCNGRKRFEGLVKTSITTLLEHAYEDWDFQRLVFSTMTFSIRPDGSE